MDRTPERTDPAEQQYFLRPGSRERAFGFRRPTARADCSQGQPQPPLSGDDGAQLPESQAPPGFLPHLRHGNRRPAPAHHQHQGAGHRPTDRSHPRPCPGLRLDRTKFLRPSGRHRQDASHAAGIPAKAAIRPGVSEPGPHTPPGTRYSGRARTQQLHRAGERLACRTARAEGRLPDSEQRPEFSALPLPPAWRGAHEMTSAADWASYMAQQAERVTHPALSAFYGAAWPAADTPLEQVELLALDVETTGLDARSHSIVSIGLIPMTLERIRSDRAWHTVVRPRGRLEEESVTFHQITHTDIRSAPRFEAIVEPFLKQLAGKVAVVHYHPVERAFLDAAVRRCWGETLQFPMIDTMQIEASLHPRRKP